MTLKISNCRGALLFGLLILSQPLVSAPVISFSETQHDFGQIPPTQKVSTLVRITNMGNETLKILSVSPGCGCTSVMTGKNSLEPLETSEVEITFDPKGQHGHTEKGIFVTSNDPSNGITVLNLMADVVYDINPSVETVYFMECERGGEIKRERVILASGNDKPVHVLSIAHPGSPYIHVRKSTKGKNVELDIHLSTSKIPRGRFEGTETILIETDSTLKPQVLIKVLWDLNPIIQSKPSMITIAGVAGQEIRVPVAIEHRNGHPFSVQRAEVSNEKFHVELSESDRLSRHEFTVVASRDLAAGIYNEKILLRLADPDQPELKLRVMAVLR